MTYIMIDLSTVQCIIQVFGNLGVLYAREKGGEWTDHFCLYYNAKFQQLPSSKEEAVGFFK